MSAAVLVIDEGHGPENFGVYPSVEVCLADMRARIERGDLPGDGWTYHIEEYPTWSHEAA